MNKVMPDVKATQCYIQRYLAQLWLVRFTTEGKESQKAVVIQSRWRGWMARKQVAFMKEELLWPLKSWFEFKGMGANSCRVEVQFFAHPRFDEYKNFEKFGTFDDLTRRIESMNTEVSKAKSTADERDASLKGDAELEIERLEEEKRVEEENARKAEENARKALEAQEAEAIRAKEEARLAEEEAARKEKEDKKRFKEEEKAKKAKEAAEKGEAAANAEAQRAQEDAEKAEVAKAEAAAKAAEQAAKVEEQRAKEEAQKAELLAAKKAAPAPGPAAVAQQSAAPPSEEQQRPISPEVAQQPTKPPSRRSQLQVLRSLPA